MVGWKPFVDASYSADAAVRADDPLFTSPHYAGIFAVDKVRIHLDIRTGSVYAGLARRAYHSGAGIDADAVLALKTFGTCYALAQIAYARPVFAYLAVGTRYAGAGIAITKAVLSYAA